MTLRPAPIASLCALTLLAACQRTPVPTPSADALPPAAPVAAAHTAAANAFTVHVSLSPAARKQLADHQETLIVDADYFGYPTVAAQQQKVPGSENPWLTLHQAQVELDGPGTARFAAVSLDEAQLGLIEKREPEVNINVYSGRKSSPDNLLDCGMFQDKLQVAAQAGVRIDCKLIAE